MLIMPPFYTDLVQYGINYAAQLDGSTGYLSRTFGTPTSQNVFTLSGWCQRSLLGSEQVVWYNRVGAGQQFIIRFDAGDTLSLFDNTGQRTSNEVFRDPSAFYHIVVVFNGGAPDVYVNGTALTWATDSGSWTPSNWNNATGTHAIGRNQNTASLYFDGLCADFYFVDGQALAPSDFGETDTATGNWKAKSYVGTYGNNGFYLDFSNAANLGEDQSSNSNDWTVNGTITQITSTPTNKVCIFNPLDSKVSVFTNGNRTIEGDGTNQFSMSRGSLGLSSGKWYWEVYIDNVYVATTVVVGVQKHDGAPITGNLYWATAGSKPECYAYEDGGNKVSDGSASAYGSTYNDTDVIQVALDLDNGAIWFGKNGIWQNSATVGEIEAGTTTNAAFTFTVDALISPAGQCYNASKQTLRCDPSDWTYTAPTGFNAPTTNNLPARSPKTPTTPQTGSFNGNLSTAGPFINLGMAIDQSGTSTINGNTITWGTHAEAGAAGVKIISASSSYNNTGSNTYSFAVKAYTGGSNVTEATAQVNPE